METADSTGCRLLLTKFYLLLLRRLWVKKINEDTWYLKSKCFRNEIILMTTLIKVAHLLQWFKLIFSFKKCKCSFIRNCRVMIRGQGFIKGPLCLNVVYEWLLFNSLAQLPSKHDSSYRCNKFLVCEKISSNCPALYYHSLYLRTVSF